MLPTLQYSNFPANSGLGSASCANNNPNTNSSTKATPTIPDCTILPAVFPSHRAAKLHALVPQIRNLVHPLATKHLARDLMQDFLFAQNGPVWLLPFGSLVSEQSYRETARIWYEGCRWACGLEAREGGADGCAASSGLMELGELAREGMRDLGVVFNLTCEEIGSGIDNDDLNWKRRKRYSRGTPLERKFIIDTLTKGIPRLKNLTFLTLDIIDCRVPGSRTKADIASAPENEPRPRFWVWQKFKTHLPTCLRALKHLQVLELNCAYEVELVHFIDEHLRVEGICSQDVVNNRGLVEYFQYYTWTAGKGKRCLEWVDDDTELDAPSSGLNPAAESFYPEKALKRKTRNTLVSQSLGEEVNDENILEEQIGSDEYEWGECKGDDYDWTSRGQTVRIMDGMLRDRDLKSLSRYRFLDVMSGHFGFDLTAPVTGWRAAMLLLTDERYAIAVYEDGLPARAAKGWADYDGGSI